MTKILKSKIGRYRGLTARDLFIDSKSDDARVSVRPELQKLHQTMMTNRLKLEYVVDLENGSFSGANPLANEIKEHLSEFCDKRGTGYWFLDFKISPTEDEDSTGRINANYSVVRWKYIIHFEQEADLNLFMAEQALITKLTF